MEEYFLEAASSVPEHGIVTTDDVCVVWLRDAYEFGELVLGQAELLPVKLRFTSLWARHVAAAEVPETGGQSLDLGEHDYLAGERRSLLGT